MLVSQVGVQHFGELVPQAEAVGEIKADGDGGNHREHALIRQGGDLVADLLVHEGVHHQDHGLEVPHQPGLPTGEVVLVEQPKVVHEEAYDARDPDGRPSDNHRNLM